MDNFHPMRFGERLWICPSWRDVPDPTAVNVMLDPGSLLVLARIQPPHCASNGWDGLDLEGKTVIDFGCGSGILAIAALKLGAAHARTDRHRPLKHCKPRNAHLNGVSERLSPYLPKDQLMTYKLMSWLLTSLLAHCVSSPR